jgi:predicted RNase H-like HicB family nuclease
MRRDVADHVLRSEDLMTLLDHYVERPYPVELIPDLEEGGFIALHPDLPGCASHGQTVNEALGGLDGARRRWIQTQLEDGKPVPAPQHDEQPTMPRVPTGVRARLALFGDLTEAVEAARINGNYKQLVIALRNLASFHFRIGSRGLARDAMAEALGAACHHRDVNLQKAILRAITALSRRPRRRLADAA